MRERVVEKFSVEQELEQRWPGWRVFRTPDLAEGCNEEIHQSTRMILVDVKDERDYEWAVAHAVAHLELGHRGADFTSDQEQQADFLAGVWLDAAWDDIPVDGEPTVRLPRSR